MELHGTGVLVTGASSGIGRSLALGMARRGARLVVSARSEEALEALAEEAAPSAAAPAHVVAADLSRPGEADRLADATLDALGSVDVLVNNAGGGVGGSQWAVGDSDAGREAFEVNFWSPVALTSAVVPSMMERGRGTIVNVTSAAPYAVPWPSFGHYAASKAALSTATEVLRTELDSYGVNVLEVIPGPVNTAVQGETRLIPGIADVLDRVALGDPDVLASRIITAIEDDHDHLFYPRAVAIAYMVPALTRWWVAREARRTFAALEPTVRDAFLSLSVRTGSRGDDAARYAREQWAAGRGAGDGGLAGRTDGRS